MRLVESVGMGWRFGGSRRRRKREAVAWRGDRHEIGMHRETG